MCHSTHDHVKPAFGRTARLQFLAFLAASMLCVAAPAWAQFGAGIPAPQPLNTNAATDSGRDGIPRLATDGHGQWVAVWESQDKLGGTLGMDVDADILVSRSADNGATWTAPKALNTNAKGDTGGDLDPHIATDGHGHWVAVWYHGQAQMDTDILVARSIDNGGTWTPPVPLKTNDATDTGFDLEAWIVSDGQSTWITVWKSNDDLGGTNGPDDDILFARSTDNGVTWTPPAVLNTNAVADVGYDLDPRIATDGQGHWVAVWWSNDNMGGTIGTDDDIFVARSSDNGVSWSTPIPLNTNAATDTGADELPQIATDGQGHWVAVWNSSENLGGAIGTDYDILVARSSDNGATWTAPAPLNSNAASDTGDDFTARVVTDGHGQWVTIWESNDGLGGTGTDYDILVARSTDNGATWTPLTRLNTNGGSDVGNDGSTDLASDGQSHWVAIWQSKENLGGTIGIEGDILTARFVLPDCNLNQILDSQDISGGASQDCNTNGIPDECETDTDGDHVIDVCDGCPNDAQKTAAGACGCGVADIDTDGDGVLDCNDTCPNDPAKTAVGVCGCGVPDADTDGDGTPDCNDTCSDDPAKTDPGNCGCGTPETDCASTSNGSSGCGAGACGPGAGVILPLTMLGLQFMKRRRSRVSEQ